MEDLVFNEITGYWVSPSEYEEFINLILEETETQREIKDGIELDYPEFDLNII
jgi:hypothetical protein